jgi:branched-chain amino acid aminotransferase
MQKTDKIWINGKLVAWDDAKVHVLSHALHYGTGIFEGIRCYNTEKGPAIFRLKEHIKRLYSSAKIYNMKIPYSDEELEEAVKKVVRVNGLKECYIRPLAYYGYGELGVEVKNIPVDVAIAAWPWGAYLGEEGLRKGVRCKISSWTRINSRSMPAIAKSTANYANAALAKMEALNAGYDEAILLNVNGLVAEGPGENIFAVQGEKLITPPVSTGILPGITRGSIMKMAGDLHIPFEEKEVMREELYTADEAFFTGTAAEVTPIREVDDRILGSGERGPVTERLQRLFFDIVRGTNKEYEVWLDIVQ